jgi:hypothetical protein
MEKPMSDDYTKGLSRPLSFGERKAVERLREIDKEAGKPYENRDQRLADLRRDAGGANKSPRRV